MSTLRARGRALVLATLLLAPIGAAAQGGQATTAATDDCLSFVGDVSLSRRIATLADRPALWAALWDGLAGVGSSSLAGPKGPVVPALVGNLEGALQPDPATACQNPLGICLPILPRQLPLLSRAPFFALSLENNHSGDYGAAPRSQLAAGLRDLKISALTDEEDAPVTLLRRGANTWALVAVNLINRSADEVDATLLRLRLRLGLARAHTPWVVVLPHWGREYDPQAGPLETKLSELFFAWGARLVVGAHPHVPGDVRCRGGSAMYYSLGNFLFDQPIPATHEGRLLRCCPGAGRQLACQTFVTQRRPARDGEPLSALLPAISGEDPAGRCLLDAGTDALPRSAAPAGSTRELSDTAWGRHPRAATLRFVQPFRSLGAQHYFALRRLYSTFDQETALRPYVFAIAGGQLMDIWRGTALSWPLLYARLFTAPNGRELLCALHRGDSFVHRQPQIDRGRRFFAIYEWSGFGFRQVNDAAALAVCERL
ncbi:MAG TPA: CapA family protein [Pseudomonadota bacterium]|nr:CapA family protein [Pseudomonadota bacterium]